MRTITKSLRAGFATGAVCLVLLVGCGANTSNAAKRSHTTTTTAASSDSTTSTPGSTTTEAADTTTTTRPEASTTTEVATSGRMTTKADVDWNTKATDYDADPVGTTVRYPCPAGGTVGPVWGSGPYTSDSSVCTAAVHAGAITLERGGSIVIRTGGAEASFKGSTAHGVTTADWGSYPRTFTIAKS